MEFNKDGFEDIIEHLYKVKSMACKAIKKLEEYTEAEDEEEPRSRSSRYKY